MYAQRTPAIILSACALTTATAQTPTWSLSTQPVLSIGQVEGHPEYLLNQVAHVRRLSSGRIVLTMGPELRFYDARGRYTGKAGGRGRGPGEFQYIRDLLVLPGDTLLALDHGRKVWLNADGEFVSQERVTLPSSSEWSAERASLLPNGNLLSEQVAPGNAGLVPGARSPKRPVLRYSILNVRSGTVQPLRTAGGLRQIILADRTPVVQPFTPHARHAIGVDRVYVGDNDTTFISVFTLDGKAIGIVQVASKPKPVTRRDLQRYRQYELAFMGEDARRRATFERHWAVVPKPKRFPYWGSAIVDQLGHLWVSEPQPAQPAPLGWSVFDGGGRRIARAILPSGFTPIEIGRDYVLGITRDELNVETVRMYALNRSSR